MRKILFCLFFLLLSELSFADVDFGLVTTSDVLRLPLLCLDSNGIKSRADSYHVAIHFEGEATANSASYTNRFATGGATDATVDSFVTGSAIYWYWFDAVADVDNDEGEGNYTGVVTTWCETPGIPTENFFSFELYATERETIFDSIGLAEIDVQNIDAWDPILDNDSLIIDQSTIEDLSLASRAAIGDTSQGVDEVQAEVANLNGWTPILDNDSLIIDQSSLEDLALASRSKIGDTSSGVDEVQAEVANLNGWSPILDNDSLIIDQSSLEDMTVATVTNVTNEVSADVTKISGDATAADNFETMLDGTGGQIFSLRGLHIRGTAGNDTALICYGYGAGHGASFYGGATNGHGFVSQGQGAGKGGYFMGGSGGTGLQAEGQGVGNGAYFYGGETNGNGIQVLGQGSGDGIFAQGGTAGGGYGMLLQGGSSADAGLRVYGGASSSDIELANTGTISDGTNQVFMTNNYEDLFDEISTGCIVEDSTGNTTTRVQTNLAEATDDHYNGAMIFFIDGTEAGTYRRITDYNGTNGYIVFDPALTGIPGSGDSMRVMPWASVSASATVDNDAIWDNVSLRAVVEDSSGNTTTMAQTNLSEATDDHFNGMAVVFISGNEEYQARRITDYNGTNGYIIWDGALTGIPASGDSLRIMRWSTVSASASLPDSTLGDISDLANKKVAVVPTDTNANGDTLAVVGTDQIMRLRGLHIKGTTGNDTGLIAQGYGGGYGGFFYGGSDNGDGIASLGRGTGDGIWAKGGTTNGYGITGIGQGTASGFYATSLGTGHGALFVAGTNGDGMRATGDGTGEGAFFYGGATNGHGLYAVGQGSGYGGFFYGGVTDAHGLYARGQGAGHGIYARAGATGKDIYLGVSGSVSDGTNDVVMDNNYVYADSIANRVLEDSTSYHGASASGTGSDTVKIFAVDTSGTDVAVVGVRLSFKDLTGSDWSAPQYTNTSGHIYLTATANDTIVLRGHKTGYVWSIYDTVCVTGVMSDTIHGYDVAIGNPGGDSTTRMFGYAYDVGSNGLSGVIPKAVYISTKPIYDTINQVYVINQWFEGTASDANGKWYIDIKQSNVLYNGKSDPIKAIINLEYPSGESLEAYRDTVPADVDSFRVTRY